MTNEKKKLDEISTEFTITFQMNRNKRYDFIEKKILFYRIGSCLFKAMLWFLMREFN